MITSMGVVLVAGLMLAMPGRVVGAVLGIRSWAQQFYFADAYHALGAVVCQLLPACRRGDRRLFGLDPIAVLSDRRNAGTQTHSASSNHRCCGLSG